MAKAEMGGLYLVHNEIMKAMDEMARAADTNVQKSLAASFVSKGVKCFEESTMQILIALACRIAAESGGNVVDTEIQLTSLKS